MTAAGSATLDVTYRGSSLAGWPKQATVLPAGISAPNSILQSVAGEVVAGDALGLTLEARDSFGNLVCSNTSGQQTTGVHWLSVHLVAPHVLCVLHVV